ncbi:hypothetical protein ABK040_005068 [Willaertia magna]
MPHIKFNKNGSKTIKTEDGETKTVSAEHQVPLKKKKTVETVTLNSENPLDTKSKFSEIEGIHPSILKAIQEDFGFESMTPIQQLTIPTALSENGKGKDIIAQAATGQGKTLSFLVPCISDMLSDKSQKKGIYILVLAPTRELVLQIEQVAKNLLKHTPYEAVSIIGGNKVTVEQELLANEKARVLIASPGKCLDHLTRESLSLDKLKYFILDEADRLLDSGFEETLKKIVFKLPPKRQTYLFSATMTDKVDDLVHLSLKNDIIKLGLEESSKKVSTLEQLYCVVQRNRKLAYLLGIVNQNIDKKMIVFCSTKAAVEYVTTVLTEFNVIKVTQLSGNMDQKKRSDIFFEYMEEKSPGILVATNVASRGLDFPNVDLVIQFDIPEQPSDFFHRSGRTARAGKQGVNILFLTEKEKDVALNYFNMLLNKDNEDVNTWDKLGEFNTDSLTESEIEKFHSKVQQIVSDNSLFGSGYNLVDQYGKVFTMFARKYGFKTNDFDEDGLKESFGVGNNRNRGSGKKFNNKRGGYNNNNETDQASDKHAWSNLYNKKFGDNNNNNGGGKNHKKFGEKRKDFNDNGNGEKNYKKKKF